MGHDGAESEACGGRAADCRRFGSSCWDYDGMRWFNVRYFKLGLLVFTSVIILCEICLCLLNLSASNAQQVTNHTFRIDDRFSQEEVRIIKKSFQRLNEIAGCKKFVFDEQPVHVPAKEFFTWSHDNKATLYKAVNFWNWTYWTGKHLSEFKPKTIGLSIYGTGDIFIFVSLNYSERAFQNLIMHELIHFAFQSSWHSSNPKSIMYYRVNEDNSFQQEEIDQLEKLCDEEWVTIFSNS